MVKKVVEPEKKERKKSTAPSPKKAKTVKMVVKGNSASTSPLPCSCGRAEPLLGTPAHRALARGRSS